MATGASTASLAIILIDARYGVQTQTRRHSFIADLLGIQHLVIAVNKMDLVDYSEDTFNTIVEQFEEFSSKLLIKDVRYIPISALNGDNVVNRSEHMSWFQGSPMLHELETLHISSDINKIDARFPVQTVLRPQRKGFEDYRGYAGRIASGIYRVGDEVAVLPSGFNSKIKSINSGDKEVEEAFAPMSVAMTLEDDIDISRGDMIVKMNNQPELSQEFDVMLCWLNNSPVKPRTKYTIMHTSNEQKAVIKDIVYKMDVNTFKRNEDDKDLKMNDIARVKLKTSHRLMLDSYRDNRNTGSVILVDESTKETVAAGMIV
jgi:sulfate adenylyltransferase subunit 1